MLGNVSHQELITEEYWRVSSSTQLYTRDLNIHRNKDVCSGTEEQVTWLVSLQKNCVLQENKELAL